MVAMSNQMSVGCNTVLSLGPSATATATDRPPLSTVCNFTKTTIFVLGNQPICPKKSN